MAGQLLDGVTAVQQLAFVAINERYGRFARGGRQKTGVVSEHAALAVKLSNVDHIGSNAAVVNGHLNAGAAIAE